MGGRVTDRGVCGGNIGGYDGGCTDVAFRHYGKGVVCWCGLDMCWFVLVRLLLSSLVFMLMLPLLLLSCVLIVMFVCIMLLFALVSVRLMLALRVHVVV